MKKEPSDFWVLTRKFKSRFSGILKVSWRNGKKVLDSENANYSYDALEQVLQYGLEKTRADRAGDILILGLGGGSVIHLLRNKFRYYGKIKAVEIDQAVIDIAVKEFDIRRFDPLEIICADAYSFVSGNSDLYGLIIIDVFIDIEIPPEFFSRQFWESLANSLAHDGRVIFNAGINAAYLAEINQLEKEMAAVIAFKRLDFGANTLLLGEKK